jgi:hypothetical protein
MPSISGIARSVRTTSAPRASNACEALGAVLARLDEKPRVAQHRFERVAERSVVVDDEDALHEVQSSHVASSRARSGSSAASSSRRGSLSRLECPRAAGDEVLADSRTVAEW